MDSLGQFRLLARNIYLYWGGRLGHDEPGLNLKVSLSSWGRFSKLFPAVLRDANTTEDGQYITYYRIV